MTDYTKPTGSSGTMMIRDTGLLVEFWINSNNSTTYSDHIPWGYTVDGVVYNSTYNYPAGAGWRKVGSRNATYNQTVQFRLGNTGTGGFGGPTTFNQPITRATVPPPPNAPILSAITSTSMHVVFSSSGDGGSVVLEWETFWSTDPAAATGTTVDSYDFDLTGLTPGTTYYFWARGRNAQGWSNWSVRSQATTLSVPAAPSSPTMTDITQTTAVASWIPVNTGGSPITAYQVGYSTTDTTPTTTVSATSPKLLTGLSPGVTYYFRTRAQNAVGWSAWSAPTVAKTIAGARVKVGSVYKDAIPWVRQGGVWKVARPWVKAMGEWKQTT